MKRTLIQFDDETHRKLRARAFRQQQSLSGLVRELVAQGLEGGARRDRPTEARQLRSVAAGRSTQDQPAPVSEQHDAALAAALTK